MTSNVFSAGNPAPPSSLAAPAPEPSAADQKARPQPRKRKGHRAGKKKRSRRKSFAALVDDSHDDEMDHQPPADAFYKMPRADPSGASIDSQSLLDHR